MLDVVGTNHDPWSGPNLQAFSRRGDDVPHPRASDHWPVGLRWQEPRPKKRRPATSSQVKRAIPQWLFDNADFLAGLDEWFEAWCDDRPRGLQGLQSFTCEVHDRASSFMSSNVVQAKSAVHRLELALAALSLLKQRPLDERRLSRLCSADPQLANLIEIDVDLESPGSFQVPQQAFELLSARCSEQADLAISEETASAQSAVHVAPGLGGHQHCESTVQSLKRMKEGKPTACCELWDEERQVFTSDRQRMAEMIQANTMERQGTPRAYPLAGQELLELWQPDFSSCRTSLTLQEIECIILDSPNGKKPGPDGVPSAVLKRYVRGLARVFEEAWEEMSGDATPDNMAVQNCLALKKWLVVPKVEGANTIGKLRDLELGNEVRKVLARILFRVLGEVCQHETSAG